mmetsp:Transcript_103497/g.183861  ORF Transcript_103497/g.183861 Transcript_103497/m.183861 type:complete len:242 (-) Transcript_103497:65-790(-)
MVAPAVFTISPYRNTFWIEIAICLFCALMAIFEIYEYADCKAKSIGKYYLHTGAHHYWRIASQLIGAVILTIVEFLTPPVSYNHFVAYFAMALDGALLWYDKEVARMPVMVALCEAVMSIGLAFGLTDMGRMTTPVLLVIASIRLACDMWFDEKEKHAYKYVSAVLLLTLAWHWFPLAEFVTQTVVLKEKGELHKDNALDVIFLVDITLGHITALGLFKRLAPEVFDGSVEHVELSGGNMS